MTDENGRPVPGAAASVIGADDMARVRPPDGSRLHSTQPDGSRQEDASSALVRSMVAPDREAMSQYLDLMYRCREGFVLVGFRSIVTLARRTYFGTWREQSYRWPNERGALLQAAADAVVRNEEVFIAPLLRDRPNRRLTDSTPLPGRFVWIDVDGWTPALESALLDLGLPCLVIDSGTLGHRHVYVDVGLQVPGEQVAASADRLARVLGTDVAGSNNKFLRLPGTLNLKGCLQGGPARPVAWLPGLNDEAAGDLARLEAFLNVREVGSLSPDPPSDLGDHYFEVMLLLIGAGRDGVAGRAG